MATVPGSPFLNPLFTVIEFAAGTAMGPALRPVIQDLANFAWSEHAVRPLDPHDLAQFQARQIPTKMDTVLWAARWGLDKDRLTDLVELFRAYPDLETLLRLWRRNPDNQPHIPGALNRHGFSDDWTARVLTLVDERLAPAQIALAIVRSIIADPGLMPVQLDTSGGVVPAYTQSSIDPLTEALDSGIDKERLRVMVGEIGLPMSNQQAASALFRGLIRQGDYYRAILEGDTRPEWADTILEQAREILTANQYAELELRGFLTKAQRRLKTAQHGMSDTDSDLLFDVLGRSVNAHQIVTGLARGGTYKPPPATLAEQEAGIPPAFLASLQRGNLRPEYYSLAYANRYSYSVPFWWRALAQANAFGTLDPKQILLNIGNPPALADAVVAHYIGGAGVPTDPHVAKAQTQLWTATHRSYVAQESDDAAASPALEAAGVDPAAVPAVLAIWQHERDLIRKQLSPADIKKAYQKLAVNVTTGQPWTLDEALAALILRGFSATDARNYLNIPAR